jgi:peptidoglycan hydrolase CwlO-like protein
MSTAGKVLVVLCILATLIWIVLASDVAQYTTNANTKLHDLTVQVEKLQGDLAQTQSDIASLLTQASTTQEQIDRDYTMLRARQAEIEKARSQIQEELSRVQYELGIVQDTAKNAQSTLGHREVELQGETKGLAQARAEVQTLAAESAQLMDRLAALRKDFQTTYHANLEMLGKLSPAR